jgi:hypothetical protein
MAITLEGTQRISGTAAMGLAAIWIACLAAAVLAAGVEVEHAALPAIPGALGAGLALREGDGWRLLTAIAVVPAALLGPEIFAWTVAGASAALLVGTTASRPAPVLADPQRHLDSCRRREQAATILVVDVRKLEWPQLMALQQATRVSDSLAAKRIPGGRRIYGVLDGDDVDRAAVERRLSAALGDQAVFGWASFPADGYTLDGLIERARPLAEADAEARGAWPAAAQRLGAVQQVALESADHGTTEGVAR